MRTILVLAVGVTLASCGYYHWRKDGGGDDPAAFQRDSAECEQQAASGKWKDCMNGKGWIYDTRI